MLRHAAAWAALAVALAPSAHAATLTQTFGDPRGDAVPNLPSLDLVEVAGTIDDERVSIDLRLAGAVAPNGVDYNCTATLNPELSLRPVYSLSFGDHRFQATLRVGDSSPHVMSTEGAAWSERGVHFVARRGETNALLAWDLACTSTTTNADGSRTGDYADRHSLPATPAVAKQKKGVLAAPEALWTLVAAGALLGGRRGLRR